MGIEGILGKPPKNQQLGLTYRPIPAKDVVVSGGVQRSWEMSVALGLHVGLREFSFKSKCKGIDFCALSAIANNFDSDVVF